MIATLTGPRLLGYATGAFGTGVFSTVPALLLLYFCTETLHMPAMLAGLVVFLPKAFAVIWDPIVGRWSDRARTPLGRRRPFLLAGAIAVPLTFLLLFAAPHPEGAAAVLTVGLAYFLMATAYSVFAVPFVAIPAEAGADVAARERISSWRIGMAMAGVLMGAALAPLLVDWGGARRGYALMGAVLALICGAGMLSAFFATPSRFGSETAPPTTGLAQDLARVARHGAFVRLMFAYLLMLSGAGVVSATAPYWIVQVMGGTEADIGYALGAMLVATILTTPLWSAVMGRIGAHRLVALGAVLYGLTALATFAVPVWDIGGLIYIAFAAIGVAFAAIQIGPFALLAHVIHDGSAAHGDAGAGLFTGVWTAAEKVGLAIGPAVAGASLALGHFVSGSAQQSAEALDAIILAMAVGPAVLCWAGVLVLLVGRPRTAAAPAI